MGKRNALLSRKCPLITFEIELDSRRCEEERESVPNRRLDNFVKSLQFIFDRSRDSQLPPKTYPRDVVLRDKNRDTLPENRVTSIASWQTNGAKWRSPNNWFTVDLDDLA